MKKPILLFSVLTSLALTACGTSKPLPVEEEYVNVFVLSGQSNMQGNTKFKNGSTDNLAAAFTELGLDGVEDCYEGMPEVRTSYYQCGYGELKYDASKAGTDEDVRDTNKDVYASNTTKKLQGLFLPTMVGMGTNSNSMGPELGCAFKLKDYASTDKPIYFIKMASNGSGFAQGGTGTQFNWPCKDSSGNVPEVNLYDTFCKPFIDNNLELIKQEVGPNVKPLIRGWLWHQGESDTSTEKIAAYANRLNDMVTRFRSDYADYAKDEDGDNIAFIDGMICESASWSTPEKMNAEKQKFADSNDMNFLVDTHANEEKIAANELKVGNPGGDSMHYNTKSSLRLGMAYADIIIENGLLD